MVFMYLKLLFKGKKRKTETQLSAFLPLGVLNGSAILNEMGQGPSDY